MGIRIATFVAAGGALLAAGAPAALALPNGNHASCQAILSAVDGQRQERDDIALYFASLGFPPGNLYHVISRDVTGATYDECAANVPV
jgi:hypothetical protein